MMKGNEHKVAVLVERLLTLTEPGTEAHTAALRLRQELKVPIPMREVLNLIPAKTHTERWRDKIGVSRQGYYLWLTGERRPNRKMAQRLAELTGLEPARIRGEL